MSMDTCLSRSRSSFSMLVSRRAALRAVLSLLRSSFSTCVLIGTSFGLGDWDGLRWVRRIGGQLPGLELESSHVDQVLVDFGESLLVAVLLVHGEVLELFRYDFQGFGVVLWKLLVANT